MWKQIRVFIEDDSGLRITEGPDSVRLVQLRPRLAYFDSALLAAASSGAQAAWTALNEVEITVRFLLAAKHRRFVAQHDHCNPAIIMSEVLRYSPVISHPKGVLVERLFEFWLALFRSKFLAVHITG